MQPTLDGWKPVMQTTNHTHMKNKLEILKAVADFRGNSDHGIQVRKEYMKGSDKELRTKKSDHIAQWSDELLNVIVLTKDLRVIQLIGSECNWR